MPVVLRDGLHLGAEADILDVQLERGLSLALVRAREMASGLFVVA
jgi:hypothetical protein